MKKQELKIMGVYPNGIDYTIALEYANGERDVIFASNPQEAISRLGDAFNLSE